MKTAQQLPLLVTPAASLYRSRVHSGRLLSFLKSCSTSPAATFIHRCVKISPFVPTSRIRSDGTGLSGIFDYVLQSDAPNKGRASCWEKNSGLVLVPSAEAWLLSTKAFGLTQAEPSRIRRGRHIHRPKSARTSFVLLQRKKSDIVCEDVGGGLYFL